MLEPIYQDDKKMVFKCEDLFYPEYKGKFFVLQKTEGYGYFHPIIKAYTRGELLDAFNIPAP